MLILIFLFAGHSPPKCPVFPSHKPGGEKILCSLYHSPLLAQNAPCKAPSVVSEVLPKPQLILRLSASVFQQVLSV